MDSKKQLAVVREDLKAIAKHIEMALPQTARRYLTPDRVSKIVLMGLGRSPKLLQCTRESILQATMDCVTLGLEPGSALGHAYLVPYRNKQGSLQAQAIIGYRGYIEMARRSGQIESVNCNIVYERDAFDLDLGAGTITHKPFLNGDRGEHRLVYCIARFQGGGQHVEYMTFDQIDLIRERSRARDSGPWVTDYLEMARKTVVRRAAKYWPLSVEIAEAMELENRAESGEDAIDVPFTSVTDAVAEDERSETEKLTDDLRAQKVGAEAAVEARLRRKKVGAEVERGGKPVPLSVLVDRVRALVGYEGDDVKGWAEKKLDQKVEGLDSLTPEQMQELHTELDQVEAVMFEGKKDP